MRTLLCKACLTRLRSVQYMVVKHSLRFKMMAVGLKLAGHKKVADMITSSWKVCHPITQCLLCMHMWNVPPWELQAQIPEAPIREFRLSLR